ncbi:MAG: glycosyltransferase [Deltaproteobacteria bacterium]|nr:glycosyltransferase [Deltaproteobacteria bacterium]
MLFIIAITVCSGFSLLAALALIRVTATRRMKLVHLGAKANITVLKPLCGADDSLEQNLETFFLQRYLNYELLFGVEGENDPAIARLRLRYPDIPCRLVIHNGARGLNPKVSNIRAMLESGSHDIIVISDSNVAVSPDYLQKMVAELLEDNVGLVTSPIAGVGEKTFGALLENMQLNSQIAGCVAASSLFGRSLVVGKSVMFRRSVFDRLGGFSSVANVLAEDYVMGRMFQSAGYEVRLCQGIVRNVCAKTGFLAFVKRYLRWSVMRARIKPLAYPFEPLCNPAAIALLALISGAAGAWVLVWALTLILIRDAICWVRLRGFSGLLSVLVLAPLKDLIMFGIWAAAPLVRHISWRSHRVRISAGTRLYANRPMHIPEVSLHEEAPAVVRN